MEMVDRGRARPSGGRITCYVHAKTPRPWGPLRQLCPSSVQLAVMRGLKDPDQSRTSPTLGETLGSFGVTAGQVPTSPRSSEDRASVS
jgi:hypothetical protein